MSRKRKNKTRKLTEKDYNNYIMSLKDEKPPKLVEEYQNEKSSTE